MGGKDGLFNVISFIIYRSCHRQQVTEDDYRLKLEITQGIIQQQRWAATRQGTDRPRTIRRIYLFLRPIQTFCRNFKLFGILETTFFLVLLAHPRCAAHNPWAVRMVAIKHSAVFLIKELFNYTLF